jgi:hypothetical protein
MAGLGYDAVAIDDLVHLVSHPFYPDPLRRKLDDYRRLYERVFAVARGHGLRIFVTSDYVFSHPAIDCHLRETGGTIVDLFAETLRRAFAAFPEIEGLLLRIGEADGVDVAADFKSRLALTTPAQARGLLGRLLPLCEERGKLLVFRTWTLGAYPIGDLIWNRRTYDAVFAGLESPNLIVSMKYGPADFFRSLELNPLLHHGPQRKLIELQCRREYEGMGEYPSFVGWLYAGYLDELRHRPHNVVGLFALQAGGWAPFARLAFCGDGALWNELNAAATVGLFSPGGTVEELVAAFCRTRGIADVPAFLQFLRHADVAIEQGLYVREFAARPRYFRRVRLPPLLWVFWHNVTAAGLVGELTRALVADRPAAVAEGYRAVETVEVMRRLAEERGLPTDGLCFQRDTFALLARLREALLGVAPDGRRDDVAALLTEYRRRYPAGYRFDATEAEPMEQTPSGRTIALLLPLLLRRRMAYRPLDRLLLSRPLTRLQAVAADRLARRLPRFVDKQGMATDVLLR